MPVIEMGPDVSGGLSAVAGILNLDFPNPTVGPVSRTLITIGNGETVIKIIGFGFDVTLNGDVATAVAGTVRRIEVSEFNRAVVTLRDLDLELADLITAINSDQSGTDPSAIEDLLLPLPWRYIGNERPDLLSRGTESPDGVLFELSGNNEIFLQGGSDAFAGGSGNDDMRGAEGSDKLWGEVGDDLLFGGEGRDKVYGGDGNDQLDGGLGRDSLFGGNGNDELFGAVDADKVDGGRGNDTLNGEAGNDALTGGAGNDDLIGGGGHDTFRFSGRSGDDFVLDFTIGTDTLALTPRSDWAITSLVFGQVILENENGAVVTLLGVTTGTLTIDDLI